MRYESDYTKEGVNLMRVDLMVQLSDEELRRWRLYKEHHDVTDQEVFNDLMSSAVEQDTDCWNCGTHYWIRFDEPIDDVKCPKCGLKTHEAWQEYMKRHPRKRKEIESWFNKIEHLTIAK
ncbi:MAG: hypothetical protein M1587_05535 [Thaumarchaeota archaeon]|nr:hypothetical protein [Nitrososphaerota archaeon]